MNTKLLIGVVGLLAAIQGHSKSLEKKPNPLKQYADVHFHISNYALQGVSLKTFIDD